VTHPFHPLRGRKFKLVDRRSTWGEDRVYFLDKGGALKRLPASWTSAAVPDPYVSVSAGRSFFRPEDLLELCVFVARQRPRTGLSSAGAPAKRRRPRQRKLSRK
jgi:hypothetical protein